MPRRPSATRSTCDLEPKPFERALDNPILSPSTPSRKPSAKPALPVNPIRATWQYHASEGCFACKPGLQGPPWICCSETPLLLQRYRGATGHEEDTTHTIPLRDNALQYCVQVLLQLEKRRLGAPTDM